MLIFGWLVLVVGILTSADTIRQRTSGVSGSGSAEYFKSILRTGSIPGLGVIAAGLVIINREVHAGALSVVTLGVLVVWWLGFMVRALPFRRRSKEEDPVTGVPHEHQ